jgi:hypothetical protein
VSNVSKEEDEQSSSQWRCFGQLHFSHSMCDLFLTTPLIGFKLLILFNFSPDEPQLKPQFSTFFHLVLSFGFMQFDPQLINKLSISLIQPLIWSISAPLFTRLFQFDPWF